MEASVGDLALLRPGAGTVPGETARRLSELTEREAQVLRLIADGQSNVEISGLLHVAGSTVKTHVKLVVAG